MKVEFIEKTDNITFSLSLRFPSEVSEFEPASSQDAAEPYNRFLFARLLLEVPSVIDLLKSKYAKCLADALATSNDSIKIH